MPEYMPIQRKNTARKRTARWIDRLSVFPSLA